ncbi:hypothetical protein D3C75_1079880 [compost metagenome]
MKQAISSNRASIRSRFKVRILSMSESSSSFGYCTSRLPGSGVSSSMNTPAWPE